MYFTISLLLVLILVAVIHSNPNNRHYKEETYFEYLSTEIKDILYTVFLVIVFPFLYLSKKLASFKLLKGHRANKNSQMSLHSELKLFKFFPADERFLINLEEIEKNTQLDEVKKQINLYKKIKRENISREKKTEALDELTKRISHFLDPKIIDVLKKELKDSNEIKGSILLIDDDTFLLDMYRYILSEIGLEVTVAENGLQALSILKNSSNFDLIITDTVMPEMDGFDFLEKISSNNVLKIILTNQSQDKDMIRGKKLGAVDYIIKADSTPIETIEKIIEWLPTTRDQKDHYLENLKKYQENRNRKNEL